MSRSKVALKPSLLCKVPIGKNFVTSVYGWKNNVNNAKCNKKEFPPDVKGLNFDVYSTLPSKVTLSIILKGNCLD